MSVGNEFEQTAMEAASVAGLVLRKRFRSADPLQVERKGFHDFVTEVDRESERRLTAVLRERYPDHGIMAEEGSPETCRTGYRWIIDPLDGTTNFIHGIPTFCVSVALEDEEGLLAGAVFDPFHDEMFHASRGEGARLNGDPIRCSRPAGFDAALLSTGFPFRNFEKIDRYLEALKSCMETTSGIRRAGSAAIDLAYTACGRYDGFWETGLAPWDLAAGALLVQEAGGTATDFSGGDRYLLTGEIMAAGRETYREMLVKLKPLLLPACTDSESSA